MLPGGGGGFEGRICRADRSIFGVNTIPECRKKGYAGQLIRCAIEQAKKEGRKGLVLTCKDKLLHYYENFGFVNEGVSKSVHGNVVWYQMRLTL